MRHVMMTAALENMQRADDIALDIGVRVLNRVANACLCGQVDDLVEPLAGKQLLHRLAIGKIDPLHSEVIVLVEQRRARLLQRRIIVVVEVVDADNHIATLQQRFCGKETDETGGACDENFHACLNP